jgi:hypothetical protein
MKGKNSNMTGTPNYLFYNHTRFIEWEKLEKETGLNMP